jgi:hypothetical protein
VPNKLPKSVLSADVKPMPVVMMDTSTQDQTPKVASSPAKEKLVSELRKLQVRDTDVIQMQGCGYEKIIKDAQRRFQ